MIIPPERLSEQALVALIEEFITREGTDYGLSEVSLPIKVAQVREQLTRQQIVIVFDVSTETTTLMTDQAYSDYLATINAEQ